VRTPWVLKELVGKMVKVDFVTGVICKTCRTRNMLASLNCPGICAVRAKFDRLFLGASSQTFISLGANAFYFSEICTRFLEQDSNLCWQ
jgi:hypothetical protein